MVSAGVMIDLKLIVMPDCRGLSFALFLSVVPLAATISAASVPVYEGHTTPDGFDADSVQQLESVYVTAHKSVPKIIPAQRLAGERLQRLSAHSVADAIRYFSGVQIKDYGGVGGLKSVNIRSLGSQHVGVFYDGVEIGNAQNGIVDLGKFSLDNMEAVSLYNGQKSSIFQSAKDFASAGSIYLQSRTPFFGEGKKNNFKAAVKGGSFGTVNPSLLWERRIGENLSMQISTEYLYTTGKYKFSYSKRDGYDTTEVRKNGDVRYYRAEASLFGNIEDGRWQAKAYFYDSERGYPGASVREEPGKYRHQDRQWDRNFFLQGTFHKEISRFYRMQLNAKYAYDYLHYLSDPRLDVTTMYVDNRYRQQELYFSSVNGFRLFEWWSMNLSADLQYNTLNADLTDFAYPDRYTLLAALATSFDWGKLKVQGSLLNTFVTESVKKGKPAPDKSELTPTVVASYRPFDSSDLTFRAFYKRIFRMPTLNDLYYTFIGNKYLNPEYTTQYNIGACYEKSLNGRFWKNVKVQADFYYNEIKDKIIAVPASNQFRWTMLNLGYVEIRGADVSAEVSAQIAKVSLSLLASYTYQKAQDFTDPESSYYGGQIPYIPWHSSSVVLGAVYGSWSFNYSFIYTGERYESSANIPENYAQPWYTSDLSLSKEFGIKDCRLRIAAEVNNIFNQQYEVVQCYPMPGTNFKITASIMF